MFDTYASKHSSKREKQVIFLMLSNLEGSHYLAVIRLSSLLTRITSTDYIDFYCFNFFHLPRTEKKLESYKEVCKNKDLCRVELPHEENSLLNFTQ